MVTISDGSALGTSGRGSGTITLLRDSRSTGHSAHRVTQWWQSLLRWDG